MRHTGRWSLADRFASPWQYLPVEVRPGTCGLHVELWYDRAEGAVLDLGCLGPDGFRGWSGGARTSFVVTPDAATPGYLPGELAPGPWAVIIGLHRVPSAGVRYQVTVRTSGLRGRLLPDPLAPTPAIGSAPPRPTRRALPAGPGRGWLAGDLHSHTVHSDGALTVAELAALAAQRGLDYLAVTDHNTISHHAELPAAADRYGVVLLPGQEVTTEGGHAGALGDVGWIDFRTEPDEWLAATERGGGLLSVNHPIAGPVSWTHPMRRRPPLVEVWHWSWLDLRWTTPLAWWLAWDPSTVPVGGSDWHREGADSPLGQPVTWVESVAEDPAAIMDGLRAGRVAISAGLDGPVLLRHDGELVAIDADGLILTGPDGPVAQVTGDLCRLPGRPGHHRLLTPDGHTHALSP
jgi:hypothetical protein